MDTDDSTGLSEYEIQVRNTTYGCRSIHMHSQRMERIRQNNARLKALQLVELAQEVAADMASTRKAKVHWV